MGDNNTNTRNLNRYQVSNVDDNDFANFTDTTKDHSNNTQIKQNFSDSNKKEFNNLADLINVKNVDESQTFNFDLFGEEMFKKKNKGSKEGKNDDDMIVIDLNREGNNRLDNIKDQWDNFKVDDGRKDSADDLLDLMDMASK